MDCSNLQIGTISNYLGVKFMDIVKSLLKDFDKNDSVTKQCSIIWELGNIGPQAEKATGDLSKILAKNPNWRTRAWAAWSLGRIGGKKAQKALQKAIENHYTSDEEEVVFTSAFWALHWLEITERCTPICEPAIAEEIKQEIMEKTGMKQ